MVEETERVKGLESKFKREFSAGAIVFNRNKNGNPHYLLLRYHLKGDYWGFPRGNHEKGESSIEAAKREITEETGLAEEDIYFVSDFKESIQWFYVWQAS